MAYRETIQKLIYEEGGESIETESSTSGVVDDKNKRGKYAINEGNMHESFEGDQLKNQK